MTNLDTAALRLARAYCAWSTAWEAFHGCGDNGEGRAELDAVHSTKSDLNAAEAAFREAEKPQPIEDYGLDRCDVCGWSLAVSRDLGCVKGDCSYRPSEGSEEWHRIKARRAALDATRPGAAT